VSASSISECSANSLASAVVIACWFWFGSGVPPALGASSWHHEAPHPIGALPRHCRPSFGDERRLWPRP
jgi:hypothetical protein